MTPIVLTLVLVVAQQGRGDSLDRAVQDTPVASDATAPSEIDETPQELEPFSLALQLMTVSLGGVGIASAFHVAQLFYWFHVQASQESDKFTQESEDRFFLVQTLLGTGAAISWVAAALIAGTGVAFFFFNPMDGSVSAALSDE